MSDEATVPATTAHWCPKGQHAYRCSHERNERCTHGNHSEVNCPEHGGPKHHPVKLRMRAEGSVVRDEDGELL